MIVVAGLIGAKRYETWQVWHALVVEFCDARAELCFRFGNEIDRVGNVADFTWLCAASKANVRELRRVTPACFGEAAAVENGAFERQLRRQQGPHLLHAG